MRCWWRAGATHHYFGHDDWKEHAPGLKTIEDATEIRSRILLAFEIAERETDAKRRHAWLTFVVVGAGPTGVELAGALGEIANDTLRNDFRAIHPADAEIILLEADRSRAAAVPADPLREGQAAARAPRRHGAARHRGGARRRRGRGGAGRRARGAHRRAHRAVGGRRAGVAAGGDAGARHRRADRPQRPHHGRSPISACAGHPEIFAIGDMAHVEQDGALAAGHRAGGDVRGTLRRPAHRAPGCRPLDAQPFRYFHKGTMATIGRKAAVADLRFVHLSGLPAWLAWLFVHLLYLVEFDNRLLVLIEWAYSYVTRNRGARLITGGTPLPLPITRRDTQADAEMSRSPGPSPVSVSANGGGKEGAGAGWGADRKPTPP